MAILKSLIFDGSKGSIGNVTLAVLKGQTIAKQKIANPTPSATSGQVDSRGRMSNAVMAWQFLAIFFLFFIGEKKQTESIYNSFIRLTKSLFSPDVAATPVLAINMLIGSSIGLPKLCEIISSSIDGDDIVVSFATGGLVKPIDAKLRMIAIKESTSANVITEMGISDEAWAEGSLTIPNLALNYDLTAIYMYSLINRNNSNCRFSE